MDVGQRITWTLTVNNTGAGMAYNVIVTDVVGSNFNSVQATNGTGGTVPTIVGSQVVWKPNPIAASGSWTAQVSGVLVSAGSNQNVVTATASCDTGCLATQATDVAHVTLLNRFDKGPAVQTDTIGSQVVFTFTGSLPDTDALYQSVRLTDTLPTGLGYLSAVITYTYDGDGNSGGPFTTVMGTPTSAPASQASGSIIWALGNLSGTVQFNGKVNAIIQNVASQLCRRAYHQHPADGLYRRRPALSLSGHGQRGYPGAAFAPRQELCHADRLQRHPAAG